MTGKRKRFASAILPAWCRRSPQVAEVLPLLYLHGMSSGDFVPALEQFLGSAAGLSASTITRLTGQWQDDAEAFNKRLLKGTDYVYCWVDGIHLKVRLEQDKVCLLVIIGVRVDGTKELIALADGFRESGESWADLLRDCKRRGMRAPALAVGDGALGFWKALREVFPETREQRCWFHVQSNVLSALPKSAHPGAKAALTEIFNAEDRDQALKAAKAFEADYGAKWPKATAKITEHLDVLLAFYDYPAEHWIHLKTSNPIESTFSTVRARTNVTKGPGSRQAGLAMALIRLCREIRPITVSPSSTGRWCTSFSLIMLAMTENSVSGATVCTSRLIRSLAFRACRRCNSRSKRPSPSGMTMSNRAIAVGMCNCRCWSIRSSSVITPIRR